MNQKEINLDFHLVHHRFRTDQWKIPAGSLTDPPLMTNVNVILTCNGVILSCDVKGLTKPVLIPLCSLKFYFREQQFSSPD